MRFSVNLPAPDLVYIDELVSDGVFGNRSAAVEAAVALLRAEHPPVVITEWEAVGHAKGRVQSKRLGTGKAWGLRNADSVSAEPAAVEPKGRASGPPLEDQRPE